jgi:hypothetical protein
MSPSQTKRSHKQDFEIEYVGQAPPPADGELYKIGECYVIQTDKRHFSISHPDRYPTWDEIAAARYALLPKLRDCVMVLPPDDEYANVHDNCFHVHLLRELGPGGRFHNPNSW